MIDVLIWVGVVALVVLPIGQMYAKIKQDEYREHGKRTGEW